ncbi:MAG: methionyl-tRNA formyltransferase [Methylacidiphilales bacterium]|nr:methionyl-tRNA formyltransferase [Candidatus Methylacidiphilales bacterium]MDW8349806.1 methionyl-tRNA formyltransferase [Verrucomicrobiae bacterium]
MSQSLKIVFVGTSAFAVPALNALAKDDRVRIIAVVTQPDRPSGRGLACQPSPVKKAAFEIGCRIYQPERFHEGGILEQLRYEAPDLMVVAAYGQILKRPVLDLPRLGCLNIHASLLPKYRGPSPIQTAILNREKETGVTIMWMDEGLDTGDIFLQERVRLRRRETAVTLHDRLAELGSKMIIEAVRRIQSGQITRIPQSGEPSWTKKILREDGKIDWTQSREAIDAQIRALQPWPGAYTTVRLANGCSGVMKIYSTILSRRARGRAGEVLRTDRHGILVACGETGGLLLREVQLEGRRRMHARDFILGHPIAIGTILGE